MDEQTVYNFGDQKHIGDAGEAEIRAWLKGRGYWTWDANRAEQRRGIDFWMAICGEDVSVEVKTDMLAGRTGNAFIETRVADKLGWAQKCRANVIFYWVPLDEDIIVLEPDLLRGHLEKWKTVYRTRVVQNTDYDAEGILVPLSALHRVAREVIHVTTEGEGT